MFLKKNMRKSLSYFEKIVHSLNLRDYSRKLEKTNITIDIKLLFKYMNTGGENLEILSWFASPNCRELNFLQDGA